MIVPGPAGYSYNKVAVTDFKNKFCLKRCDLILFTWNKLLPSRFKLTDLLLWQQLQEEPRRTKWSKIKRNRQQSNPANWVSDVRRTGPWIKRVIHLQNTLIHLFWTPHKKRQTGFKQFDVNCSYLNKSFNLLLDNNSFLHKNKTCHFAIGVNTLEASCLPFDWSLAW